ncbi:MAG: penicillin-insensitive murein endopeptidase [Deltaproteobacteria bacterium]|nr:penicillin-insensitive murein endopeptidase [Deltaproteobacteria bacterium]
MKNGRLSCKIQGKKIKKKKHFSKKSIRKSNIYPWKSINRSSKTLTIGSPWNGALHKGRKIPVRGKGYMVLPRTIKRGHYYGTSALINLIRDTASRISKSYPGSKLTVGDLSRSTGGFAPGHRSHQSGRDVDLGFYILSTKHHYRVIKDNFPRFNNIARGVGPYKNLILDLERNWELVELLTKHPSNVIMIIVSKEIKSLLLNYAQAVARPPATIAKAKRLMVYAPWHEDHFHVRIGCPPGQKWCR